MTAKHPCPFNDKLLDEFRRIITRFYWDVLPTHKPFILDLFAGIGRIHELEDVAWTLGVEIEREWAEAHERTVCGDSTRLPLAWSEMFDMIITSPTYGNRMADKHVPSPEDTSRRITYTHTLGRPLDPMNSGGMQWGIEYRHLHAAVYANAHRVLKHGGLFVINVKDHIRAGGRVPVSDWHKRTAEAIGFVHLETIAVPLDGMRYGANSHLRVGHEDIHILQKTQPERYRHEPLSAARDRAALAWLHHLGAHPDAPAGD